MEILQCKLCDNVITDHNFKVIDEVTKDMFGVLLPRLIFDNRIQCVVCEVCSSKLFAAFNFKTKCLYTNNSIITYVDFENPTPIDLKDVYAKENGSDQVNSILNGSEICRLCLQSMLGKQKSIQEVPLDSIQIFMPEINFDVSENPAICVMCQDSVHVHSTFIKNILEMQKKNHIDAKIDDIFSTNRCIKTEDIAIKSEGRDEKETPFEILYVGIKKEESEEGGMLCDTSNRVIDTSEIKSEYSVDDSNQGNRSPANYKCSSRCQNNTMSETCETCLLNPQLTNRDPLEVHMHKCDTCKFYTKHKRNLTKHQLRHKDPSQVPTYVCEDCGYKSIDRGNFKRHQLKHKDPSEVQMYQCQLCDYETKYKVHLATHHLVHRDASQAHMYKCDKCTFKTDNEPSLTQHQLRHSEMYCCDDCDYKSTVKRGLKKHQLVHKDPAELQTYKCKECTFTTRYKTYLKQHQLRHKDSEAPMYECNKCQFKTKYKHSLVPHQLVHKDPLQVLMYKCDQCTYEVKYKNCLKLHQLKHKDPSEAHAYKCNVCDYKTRYMFCFKSHLLRHKDPSELQMFKCDECKFETKHKRNLAQYLLTHKDASEVRMYKCDECEFKTIRKDSLKRHQSRHKDPSEAHI